MNVKNLILLGIGIIVASGMAALVGASVITIVITATILKANDLKVDLVAVLPTCVAFVMVLGAYEDLTTYLVTKYHQRKVFEGAADER